MEKFVSRLQKAFLILLLTALIVGCSKTLPLSSPISISTPLSTLTSELPTPPIGAVHNRMMLVLYPTDGLSKAALYISDPDGSDLQMLIEVSPDPGSVLISPNGRFVAFFTSDVGSEGALIVWDLVSRETILNMPVPAEISRSFRDAPPIRYLAWSPDSRNLAIVMGRDLYLANIVRQESKLLVRHREEQYNLAGLVMGTIGHPAWTTDGRSIVYDTFSPPDILSASADQYRDIEYVDIATGASKLLLSKARILQQIMSISEEPELLIQSDNGRYFSLHLGTLELQELSTLPSELQGQHLCDAWGRSCASISSERRNCDLLRLTLSDSHTHEVLAGDIGKTPDCQFQSILWSPGGDVLFLTVGCASRAELWSLRISDLQLVQLRSWTGINMALLLSWLN